MTAKEMMDLIGKVGSINLDGFVIDVLIEDVRNRFGSTDFQVTPVHGSGTKWVASDRVTAIGR